MWLPWKGQPTGSHLRYPCLKDDCFTWLSTNTSNDHTKVSNSWSLSNWETPTNPATPYGCTFPWSHLRLALSQIWCHEDSNHMAASLPNWHNRRNTANGFTLASLYYSIVNPCHSKLVVCILFKSEAFVFYSELTKLQNLECTAAYWRLPQRPLKFWSSLLVTGLVLSDPTNPIIYMGTKDAVQDLGIGWSSKQK